MFPNVLIIWEHYFQKGKKRMANTKISRCEQETIICFNQADKTACISTFKSNWITKLKTFAEDYPDLVTLNREDPYGCYTFTVPKRCISLRSPKKREISEEQKQAMSERAKTMFSKNSSIDNCEEYEEDLEDEFEDEEDSEDIED